MRKYVDAELNQEDYDKINMHLEAIKELLPFIINLTIDQRRKLPKMNHRRKPFVEKVLYYASNDQSLIPPHIDVEAMKRNVDLYNKLTRIEEGLNMVKEMISDTLIGCGSDNLNTAYQIYKAYQIAGDSHIPGIDSVLEDLREFFKRGKYKKNQEESSSFEDNQEETN